MEYDGHIRCQACHNGCARHLSIVVPAHDTYESMSAYQTVRYEVQRITHQSWRHAGRYVLPANQPVYARSHPPKAPIIANQSFNSIPSIVYLIINTHFKDFPTD